MLDKYPQPNPLHTLRNDKAPPAYLVRHDTTRHLNRTAYPHSLRIYVASIDYKAQRRLFKTTLLAHVQRIARLRALNRIELSRAQHIPPRAFWTAIGFTPQRQHDGHRKRKRKLIGYSPELPHARPV